MFSSFEMQYGGHAQYLAILLKLTESIDYSQLGLKKCQEIFEETIKRKLMFFDRVMNLFDDLQRTQRSQNETILFQEHDDVEDIDEGYSENNLEKSVNLLPMLEELDLSFTEIEISKESNVKDQHSEVKYCSDLKLDNNSGHIGEKYIASFVPGQTINAEPIPRDNAGQGSTLTFPLPASESSQLSSVEKVELKDTVMKVLASSEKATQTFYQLNEANRKKKQIRNELKKRKHSHLQKSNTEQLNTVEHVISKKHAADNQTGTYTCRQTLQAELFSLDDRGQDRFFRCLLWTERLESSQNSPCKTDESKHYDNKAVPTAETDLLAERQKLFTMKDVYGVQLILTENSNRNGFGVYNMALSIISNEKLWITIQDQWSNAEREKKQSRVYLNKRGHSHLDKLHIDQMNICGTVISNEEATDNQTGTYTVASTLEILSKQMPALKYVYCVQLKLTENSNRNGFGALSIISNEKLWITIQALQEYSKLILLELHPELIFSRVDIIQKAVLASLFSLWTYLLGCKLKGGLNASAVVSFEDLYNALEVVSYRCIDSANIFPDTIRMFVHFPVLNFSGEGILVTANGHDLFQQTKPQKKSTKQRMRDSERIMKIEMDLVVIPECLTGAMPVRN